MEGDIPDRFFDDGVDESYRNILDLVDAGEDVWFLFI